MKNKATVRLTAWITLSVIFIIYVLVALFSGSGAGTTFRDAFYELTGFVTVVTLVYTAIKMGPEDRRLWTFFAVGGVLWMTGDIAYRGAEILGVAGTARVLSPPDLFYVLAYASFICAVQSFAGLTSKSPGGTGAKWIKLYAPGVAIFSFFMSGVLAMFMPGTIGVSANAGSTLSISMIVNYMYPALDIGILGGLLLVVLTQNDPYRQAWQGIGLLGLALFTLADMNYSLAEPAGIYSPDNIVSRLIIAFWILGDILIIMAAIYRLTEKKELETLQTEYSID